MLCIESIGLLCGGAMTVRAELLPQKAVNWSTRDTSGEYFEVHSPLKLVTHRSSGELVDTPQAKLDTLDWHLQCGTGELVDT